MGRSVSYASGSEVVVYSYFEYEDEDDYFAQESFEESVEYLKSSLEKAFPSLYESDEWFGREDRALVENRLAYIGLSEYCNVVSVWVKPKDEYESLGARFARQIESKLRKIVKESFGRELVKLGTFSNGESIYSERA